MNYVEIENLVREDLKEITNLIDRLEEKYVKLKKDSSNNEEDVPFSMIFMAALEYRLAIERIISKMDSSIILIKKELQDEEDIKLIQATIKPYQEIKERCIELTQKEKDAF